MKRETEIATLLDSQAISEDQKNAAVMLMQTAIDWTGGFGAYANPKFEKLTRGHKPEVEVTLTINGESMPVVKTLAKLWRREEAHIEERAQKRALEIVGEAGLQPIMDALVEAKWKCAEAIRKVTGKPFGKNDY